ncbi:HEAT repeat domain-containing protein [Natronomonas sp. F2-12]|jgi:HEAT repeat protein|uniref:HEAT repeat domain-containing protein n=1 Tax=Natronomonas aquatica TaxID=2841590 RepID=A0A9R1D4C9_9EURY|nr:HEAT repeat domain-containing protein [Natronomonas aquatica]MCQ4333224.1 HEAT repeat domain-containing protein [Natronomonas aquatica]
MSLYQLERERDIDELVETLRRSDNPSIRRRAAEIIGGLFESDDVDGTDVLPEPETQNDLGIETENTETESDSVVDVLVSVVGEDDDRGVRAAAIDALDKHSQEAIERVVTELSEKDLGSAADWVAAKAFAEVLDDEQPELRMAAATGLGRVGDPSVTAALVERLEDSDPRVRCRSATACGRIGDPRAVEPLEERLRNDRDIDVRRAAAEALGEIGNEGAMRVLIDGAGDPNESIRRVVADSLGAFGSVAPVETLADLLEDESEAVRRTTMFSMVEILSNAPPQRSHDVREATAEKLESATAGEVIPPLSEILTESSGTPQRRNAAWLLGRVVGDQHRELAREALVDALGDDDGMTAQFAATSLARLGDPSLESELLELVDDSEADEAARSKALFVLGKVGGETTREELGEFVDRSESDALREQAFSALSKLGGIGAGETP